MSILIGLHIKKVLEANLEVNKMVGDRLYPLVVPVGTPQYPFIVFRNSGTSNEVLTKDGSCEDRVNCEVTVVSKDYYSAISLGNEIRYSFEDKGAAYDKFEVLDCEVIGSSESFEIDIDAYTVSVSFSFKTIDK